jgi:hypothetical protein
MAPSRPRPVHMPSPHTFAFARFREALSWPTCAILASGIISASRRPNSVADAVVFVMDAHSDLKTRDQDDLAQARQIPADTPSNRREI